MDSWSNKQGVIERYTRGKFSGWIKYHSVLSGGIMLLAHSMHGEIENLVQGALWKHSVYRISKYSSTTSENSLNWFLDQRELSSVRKSADSFLDSPMPFTWGFCSSGTWIWMTVVSSKCFTTIYSSGARLGWFCVFSFNFPELVQKIIAGSEWDIVWSDTAVWEMRCVRFPSKNPTKLVSNATGDPGGPFRRPCNRTLA